MNDARLSEITRKVERFAATMDDSIHVPGTNIRFGWDPILGLLPGVGDTATLVMQLYVVGQALRAGARKRVLARMMLNSLIDFLVGVIPGVGDVFDVFWKSNRRNAELLKREILRNQSLGR